MDAIVHDLFNFNYRYTPCYLLDREIEPILNEFHDSPYPNLPFTRMKDLTIEECSILSHCQHQTTAYSCPGVCVHTSLEFRPVHNLEGWLIDPIRIVDKIRQKCPWRFLRFFSPLFL